MKLLTFKRSDQLISGLCVGNNSVIDLQAAMETGRSLGLVAFDGPAPSSLLDFIGMENPIDCAKAIFANRAHNAFSAITFQEDHLTLAAPIPRPSKNVFCVGRNYAAHASEYSRTQKIALELPEHPVFFSKPPTSVIGPDEAIFFDAGVTEKLDYEVELGVIIGKSGYSINAADAMDHVFGYTIINDISARDIQRIHGGQYLRGKGLDRTCPMGPHIITADEVSDIAGKSIRLWVNDELRQDGDMGDLIFPIPAIIESLSLGMTLEPGDVIATGTPSGVGYAMDPPKFLRPGDKVVCEIESVGRLSNPVGNG